MARGRPPAGKFGLLFLLRRIAQNIRLLILLVRDFLSGRYRQVPKRTIAVFILTLIYLIFPFDLVPDLIPGYGQIDDAVIFLAGLWFMEKDLLVYQQWRQKNAAGHP